MKIEVYTDGSATTKDKPGGYGVVIVVDGDKWAEFSGHLPNATNNDAEMEGAIQGLAQALKLSSKSVQTNEDGSVTPIPPEVYLVSDSQLVLGWADGTYRFKQVSKQLKYDQLRFLVNRLSVKTRWVKGHAGDPHNERCDKLANGARIGVLREREKERNQPNTLADSRIGTKKNGTLAVWYSGVLKIIDLETNVVENYDRDIHGSRGSMLEIKEDKRR